MSKDVKFHEYIYPYHIFHSTSHKPKVEVCEPPKQDIVWSEECDEETQHVRNKEITHAESSDAAELDSTGDDTTTPTKGSPRRSRIEYRAHAWHSYYQVRANYVQRVIKT